jgi:superfamily II DNA/RNA helicase
LLLEGKDLLARGRTGSGKTGAFSIPLVQRILDIKVDFFFIRTILTMDWSLIIFLETQRVPAPILTFDI